MKFTYNPTDGETEVTTIFGKVVEAGDSVEITDERQIEKLKNHPEFQSSKSRTTAASQERAKEDEKLGKMIDTRAKKAAAARAKADEADADADAAERARVQAQAIADARAAGEGE
jgi:septal ring factor EnvC (AmiA/AmiB activator)